MNGKNNAHLRLTAKSFRKMFMVLFCHLFNIICFSVVSEIQILGSSLLKKSGGECNLYNAVLSLYCLLLWKLLQ